MCGSDNRLTDHRHVWPGEACIFFRLATGDHQPGGDLHFTEHVTLVIAVALFIFRWFGVGDRLFHQSPGIGEQGQGDTGTGTQVDFVHRQTVGGSVVRHQAERVPGFDDKQARAVQCHQLGYFRVQRGGFARSGRAEQQQMAVLGAV